MFIRTTVFRFLLAVTLLALMGAPAAQAADLHAPGAQSDEIEEIMAGEPLINDDFSADTLTWAYNYDGDTASYLRDGALHVSVDTDNAVAWADADVSLSDFLAEVTLYQYTEPLPGDGGIIFRYVDSDNFYYFAVNDQGQYRFDALIDDEWEALIDWTDSDLIEVGDGAENLVGVMAVGPQLTFIINDEIVDEIEDDTFSSGGVALAAGSRDTPGVDMVFDDFGIWQIGDEPVDVGPVVDDSGDQPPVEDDTDVLSRVESIRAGEPTYEDGFQQETSGWDTESTDEVIFTYDDDMLYFNVVPDNTIHYIQPGDLFSDFLAEVDTIYSFGPEDAEYGIYFRNVDGSNYYFYAISPLGSFSLWKLMDDEWESVLSWADSDVLATGVGAENKLGVLAEGSSITLLANDEVLAELEDDAFADGSLGLFVGSFDEGDVEVGFDNLKIWSLGGQEQIDGGGDDGGNNGGDDGGDTALTDDEIDEWLVVRDLFDPTLKDDFRRNTGAWDLEPTDSAEFAIARRALNIAITEPNMLSWSTYETPAANFILEADVSSEDPPLDGHYGFVFRMVDSDNFYEFAISPRGTYTLQKMEDGEWVDITDWTESDAIDTTEGAVNRLGVLADGPNIVLLINDEVVNQVTDDSFADGSFGMMAGVFDEAGLEATFDNVALWDLDEQ